MNIIISIKPIYAEKILNWEKLYELRRLFTKKEIGKVIIYESAPISRVVGEFEVEKVLYKSLEDLWEATKDFSCVDKAFFDEYFRWKEFWYAIKVKNPKRYQHTKPITNYWIEFPPQSYTFLKSCK